MKKLTFLSNLWRLFRGSQKDESKSRLHLVFDSLSTRLRVCPQKLVAVLAILLTIGNGNVWGATASFSYTDLQGQGSSGSGSAFTGATIDDITMGGSGNGNTSYVQIYSGNTLTFTPLNGATITGIVLTGTSNTYIRSWTASSGSISVNQKKATWTGSSTSVVTLTNSAGSQARITSMVVTYTAASCTNPATLLTISSANTATIGSPLSLTTSGGNNGAVTWSITSGGSYATLSGSTLTPTAVGSVTVQAVQGVNNGKCGRTVTQTITISKAAATITLSEAGATSSVSGTHYGGDSYTLPTTTSATCGSKVLVGWSTVTVAETNTKPSSNYYDKGTSVTLSAGENKFYAVFATASVGGATPGSKTLVSNSSSTYYASGYITGSGDASSATWTADAFTMTQNKNSGSNISLTYAEIRAYQYHSLVFTPTSGTTITSIVVTANSNAYATALGGSSISNCTKSVSSSTVTITPTDGTAAITLVQAAQSRLNKIVVNYTTGGTSYSAYSTSCCTPLGSINGSVNLTQSGTSVTVKGWTYTQGSGAAESNISTYDVYLYSDADSYADPIATQTCAYNAKGTGVTFTSLSYGTTYKIKIGATAATNYCDITPVQVTTINSTSTQTFQLACDVPTNVTATSVTASSATVSWDDVATNYLYVLDQSSSDPAGAGTAVNGAHSVNLSVSASTNYYFHVRTNCGNSVFSSWATISFSTPAAACTGYSFHDGTDGSNPSDWQINCFTYSGNSDRQWLKDFTIRNKSHYYVGYQGNFYNDNLGNSNAKSYTNQMQYMQLALDRTHGSNNQLGSNYAGVQGTLLCYDNSNADNLYVDFLPDGYYFILDAAGTPTALEMTCTNPDMTAANILSNNSVWETSIQTITYVNKKYTVGIKANSAIAGKTWQTTRYNTNEDMTTLKKRNSSGGFTGTLAAADVTAGTRGKYRIWADNFSTTAGEKNWYAHFVPYYRVTYNGNGADGSVAASADVSCEGTASQRTVKAAANGFEVPAHTSFGGWATSASGAKVYDPNDDIVLTTDVELFAIWTPEANASITLNNYTGSAAPTNLYAGDSWNLPSTNTYTCGDKTFVGWSTVTVASTDTKPTSNFYEPGASVTLAASNTFYAVFANGSDDADFELVTDASDLSVGDIVTIASVVGNSQSGSVIKAYASGNNWPKADVTTSATGTIAANTTDMQTFTLAEGTVDDTWAFYDGTGYIYAANASNGDKNYMKRQTVLDAAGSFAITIADNTYEATVISQGDVNGRNDMRYNTSNNLFSCYASTSTQPKAYLYRQPSATGYSTTCVACETVTVGYTASPTGGTVGVKKGATSIAPNGTVNVCGATVALTVRLTPATHYDITGFTATGLTTGSATITPTVGSTLPVSSTQDFTVTLSADATGTVTLTPTFTAQTPLTITLSTNSKGTFTTPTEFPIYAGETFTFPDVTPNDPSCATFVGWIAGTTFVGDGTTHDAPVTIAAGSTSDAQNANATYTAVFYETETSKTDAYVKVTAAPEAPATWADDHYLIVYEGDATHDAVAFAGSRDNGDNGNIDATSNGIAVTITGGNAIAATSTLAANEWKIASVTGGYSIQSASGYYIGRSANSNGIDTDKSTAAVNTLGYSSSSTSITASGTKVLKYNKTDGQLRFRYLTSGEDIQLYKLGEAVVETRTYTTNPACVPKYTVTIANVTGGSPIADKKFNPESTTVTITANPSSGYSFTSWTITKTTGGDNVTSTLLTGSKPTTAETTFSMPAYDITITASYAKKTVSMLEVKEGETVISTTTGPVSGTLNVHTGANKTLDVVVTPSDAYDHSWTATVTTGGTYASVTNVTEEGFRVNGLAEGDATITVNAPNDGSAKTVTMTVHVTDIVPEEIILKRDGSNTPIETLTMYYDASESKGQYVKVNVGYSPANPTNKSFTFSSAATGKVGSHSHAPASGYEVLVANGVTSNPVNCTFTSSADGTVTKNLAVTVLPILTDTFVDYIHGNATQYASARLSNDRYTIVTDINTPSLSDASDANPTSEDCETSHYHLIGWLPKSTAEALWAAGTAITDATEGLVRAGAEVDATGQVWYAIWAEEQ